MASVSRQRQVAAWLALVMFVVASGVVVLTVYRNVPSLIVALPGLALLAVAVWWALTESGPRRRLSVVVGIAGVVLIGVSIGMTVTRPEHFVWRAAIILAILVATLWLGRFALTRPVRAPHGGRSSRDGRPTHPVLLCNPWSGGGKVEKFGLVELARELGVEVVLLDKGLDLEELTRDAVSRGADCLGMAGGDGSQALVASVAVEHDLPFVCVSAGTRNHFALDLGLDRADPRLSMYAYRDAVERHVDYATVNDRLFVNNVSLGVYATIVQSDEYRDAKVDVARSMLTDLLGRQSDTFDLQYTPPGGKVIDGAFLIMVSNNRYVLGARRDAAQRRRLDAGVLGVFAVSTRTGRQAARLMTLSAFGLQNYSRNFYEFEATEFEVRSRSGTAYMGVDGEALESPTPLQFKIVPQGLRMLVPEGNLEIMERRRARDVRTRDVAEVALGREPERGVAPRA